MEMLNIILTTISTIAAVISAVTALRAKNEIKKLNNQINGDKYFQLHGKLNVENSGNNNGVVTGVNVGETRK